MNSRSWQTILEVGCEGGSLTLLGKMRKGSWIFRQATDETTLKYIFNDEDLYGDLASESGIVSTWEEALKLLGKYPKWPFLYPLTVHPDFIQEVHSAVIELSKSSDAAAHMGAVDWDVWNQVLFGDSMPDDDIDHFPLEQDERNPVPAPKRRLVVKRDGHSITRRIPKPIVLIDTREKEPFYFKEFHNWIEYSRSEKLKVGDYTIEGMESLLILERKSLTDLVSTLIHERERFFRQCEQMTKFRWRALLVEASYEDIKSPYDEYSNAHPNAVSGTLDALEAKYDIPVIYTSQYRPLAEEKAASWLSKHFTYWYLESQGMGRVLQEGDL